MPNSASKFTIPSIAFASQGAAMFDGLEPVLLAAGYTILLQATNHNSGTTRCRLYRFPTLDAYDSRPDVLMVMAINGDVTLATTYDINIQQAPTTAGAYTFSSGGFSTSDPSSGAPGVAAGAGAGGNFAFDGSSVYTVRTLVSEYGVFCALQWGAGFMVPYYERPMDHIRAKREIAALGRPVSTDYPFTFGAPSGGVAVHLRFVVEGITVDVTFPTAVALTSFRIAQEITRQGGGMVEAYVRPRVGTTDEIVVRIQPDRALCVGYSTTMPLLALTYQDPATSAAGLTFVVSPGAWTVTAGVSGSIRRAAYNFPTNAVRLGGTVRNHTRNQSRTITAFTTTTTVDDTAVCGDTSTWLSADAIEVYPGPENHAHGVGGHGGLYQAVVSGAETSTIVDGTNLTVILNDKYGEAQPHYQVGQGVMIANNGAAVTLALSGRVGTFLRDEIVEITTGTALGTRGRIRGIAVSGDTLAVDTIRGASGHATPYSVAPWSAAATITGATSGATATITITATPGTGWLQLPIVLAKGQVNVAAGDYRTTLQLRLTGAGINTNFIAGPCAVVGISAKTFFVRATNSTNQTANSVPLVIFTNATFDLDANRNEDVLVASSPTRTPEYETSSLQIAESLAFSGGEYLTSGAHVRTINARQPFPTYSDAVLEHGDPNRRWVCVAYGVGGIYFGALSQSSNNCIWVIGPGAVL